jgi:hypothetical protein
LKGVLEIFYIRSQAKLSSCRFSEWFFLGVQPRLAPTGAGGGGGGGGGAASMDAQHSAILLAREKSTCASYAQTATTLIDDK